MITDAIHRGMTAPPELNRDEVLSQHPGSEPATNPEGVGDGTPNGIVVHGRFSDPREHETVTHDDRQFEHEEGTMEPDGPVATQASGRAGDGAPEGPAAVDPAPEAPAAEAPVAEDLAAEDLAAEDPTGVDLAAEAPVAEDPAAVDLAAEDPVDAGHTKADSAAEDVAAADATGVTLTGRVTTVSGLVLAGASVSVLGLDGVSAGATTTEADGVYHLTGIPGGVYAVAAQLSPHRPAAALLSLSAGHAVLDLALTGRGTLRGRVVTGLAGIALADVPVRLVGPDGRTVATVFSDADGQYRFTGIDEGIWAVTVQSPRYREVTLEASVLAHEDTVVDVVLVGNGTVRGQVSSPGSTPLSGSRVLLLDAAGAVQGSVLTDASGHYDFGEVVTGVYAVVVLDLTPSVGTVEVTASEVATCDLHVRDLSPTLRRADAVQPPTSTAGEVSP